ncbi:unnamed protein product [Urochloa humidicola]
MGRRKVSMGLIPNRRVRAGTFGKRKEGLRKKAEELSVLCGVDVALLVADGDGDAGGGAAAAPDVWESKEGVLVRYRALGEEARARHTHRAYLEAELGKGEAKLARVRQGGPDGLARWDRALDGVATAEDARGLLDSIDAAMRATEERRRKLGLPNDSDGGSGEDGGGAGIVLEGVAPLSSFAAAAGGAVDDYLLHAPGGGDQAMWGGGNGFQFQQGGGANVQPGGYGFGQQYATTTNGGGGGAGMEGYHHLQMGPGMYGNTDAFQQQQGYGAFQYYGGAPSGYQQPNLSMMWGADGEQRRAMVPLEYPSADAGLLNYVAADTPAAHGGGVPFAMGGGGNFVHHSPPTLSLAMGTGSDGVGNFISAPPAGPSYAMAASGDNFTDATPGQPLAMSYGGDMTIAARYAAQWQPQRGGEQRPSVEQLHYLSDLEDTQLNLWGN